MKPKSVQRQALQSAVLVWGFEIVLVRITGASLGWKEALAAALPWAAAAGIAYVASARARSRRLAAFLGWAAPMGLATSILLPVAAARGWPTVGAVASLLVLAWIAGSRLGSRRGSSFPSPATVLGILLLSTGLTWGLDRDPLPVASLALAVAGLWLLVALRAERPLWLGTAAVLGFAVAITPADRYSIRWTVDAPAPTAPDIVLVSMDTMRSDTAERMQSYARLARRGVTFANAQSVAPWTLPSLATAMSGRPVSVHGAIAIPGEFAGFDLGKRPTPISPDVPLLAERLRDHGYDTAAVLGRNLVLTSRFGFARGFSFFRHPSDPGLHPLPRGMTVSEIAMPTMSRIADVANLRLAAFVPRIRIDRRISEPPASQVVDRALRVLRARRDRPLFLWVHFMDVHLPYHHHTDISKEMSEVRLGFEEHGRVADDGGPWSSLGPVAYAAEAEFIDRHLGRLLDVALEPDHDRGSFVVLMADHGEEFLEHGSVGHGHSLYQELVQIPLVIARSGDDDRAGVIVEEPVGVIDLAPTLLHAAGAPDPDLPGQNLLGEIEARPYVASALGRSLDRNNRGFARREGAWKAIVVPGRPVELYDLANDPGETRNLADSKPEVTARMIRASDETSAHTPLRDPVELSPREKRELRALGYIVP